ncbi:hypothetical protein [Haloplanus sp.]|uniref:hypothetical protein n=1 Tax=Haloplanus sp. TaxID=1961696 RepID=UPI00262F322B|nr:hypothetical protein [Haloplanus sp.]
MADESLLLQPVLDDDDDVRLVQRYASAGARTGAKVGAAAGPVGAGIGAGVGSAAGFFIGYGVSGVNPAERRDVTGDDGYEYNNDNEYGQDHDHDAHADGDDGPVTISVEDELDS